MYWAIETDPDVEFAYYLGEKLGKTLEEIGAMPNAEFEGWWQYFMRKAQLKDIATKRAK